MTCGPDAHLRYTSQQLLSFRNDTKCYNRGKGDSVGDTGGGDTGRCDRGRRKIGLLEGDVDFLFDETVIQDERIYDLEQTSIEIDEEVEGHYPQKINQFSIQKRNE